MGIDKYFVMINNTLAAENMRIEEALLFVEALFNKYYNETEMSITLKRMPEEKWGDTDEMD